MSKREDHRNLQGSWAARRQLVKIAVVQWRTPCAKLSDAGTPGTAGTPGSARSFDSHCRGPRGGGALLVLDVGVIRLRSDGSNV